MASSLVRQCRLWRLLLVLLVTALMTLTYLLLSLDSLQDDLRPSGQQPSPSLLSNHFPVKSGTLHPGGGPKTQEEPQEVEFEGSRWGQSEDLIKTSKTPQVKASNEKCNCSRHPIDQINEASDVNDGVARRSVELISKDFENKNGEIGVLDERVGAFREDRKMRGDLGVLPKVDRVKEDGAMIGAEQAGKVGVSKTGRHVNFYLSAQTRRYHSFTGNNVPRDNFHEEEDLSLRVTRASQQIQEVLSLLKQIKELKNHSSDGSKDAKVSKNLHKSLQIAEKLVESLLPPGTTYSQGNNLRRDHAVAEHIKARENNFIFPSPPNEVFCKETFKGTLYGYPFYEKGFVTDPCPEQTSIGRLLTVVFNFVDYPPHQLIDVARLVRQVRKLHPKVAILVALRRRQGGSRQPDFDADVDFRLDVDVDVGGATSRPAGVLNALVSRVTTPYVLIAHEVTFFDVDANILRLVREVSVQGLGAVGGAMRTADGRWTMECYQATHRNYSLVYRHGYRHSQHECLRCHYIRGPFVTRTELLRKYPLDEALTTPTIFEDYFLTLQEKGIAVALCPDVMFHIRYPDYRVQQHKSTWMPMAIKWRLNRIRLAPNTAGSEGTLHVFSCMEVRMDCAFTTGLAVPPCCLELLAEQIKFIMRTCEQNNIVCELQEGTLLGAVKLGKVLPWERDGDITFLSANFSALSALEGHFGTNGYLLQTAGETRCCVEERLAGGVFSVKGKKSPWTVEMYGYHKTDSETLKRQGLRPTKVFFDGLWVATPRNPGLHLRNRYGHEIYRHAQHWISLGKYNGWEEYSPSGFTPCPLPGRHDCLDSYSVDGNLQFVEPVP